MTASVDAGAEVPKDDRKSDPAPERASGSAPRGLSSDGTTVIRGWDPVVRLTHWGIAAAVLVNGLITSDGSASHVWVGYGAFALLLTRLIWGMVGTEPARFSAFPPSPRRALNAIGDFLLGHRKTHRSHNPVGALMAYALWGCLAAVTLSGIAMTGSPLVGNSGVENGVVDGTSLLGYAGSLTGDDEEGILSEVHEGAAVLLYWLAALHVIAVAAHGRFGDGGLIRSMLSGADRHIRDASRDAS